MRPRILDLFCGAGGAAVGYHRAGFEVVGVDHRPQPNYPFEFIQADALGFLTRALDGGWYPLTLNCSIHASPPCQAYSALGTLWRRKHDDLVAPTRDLLELTGLPWVIENVPGAPMRHQTVLCGSMFGLGANCRDGVYRQLRRHRLFETSFPVMSPPCRHEGQPVGVYGHGGGRAMTRGYKGTLDEYREAMGIDWATKAEIAQAIPPAYTEHIGSFLLEHLRHREAA